MYRAHNMWEKNYWPQEHKGQAQIGLDGLYTHRNQQHATELILEKHN